MHRGLGPPQVGVRRVQLPGQGQRPAIIPAKLQALANHLIRQ